MDAGWLKTYDDYFIQQVRKIFKAVFLELAKDPLYTYTVGDLAFFRRYYTDVCGEEERAEIRRLVGNGQLEIV